MTTEALTPCEDRPGRTGDTAHDLDAGIPLPPPPKLDSVNAAHSTLAVRATRPGSLAARSPSRRQAPDGGNGWGVGAQHGQEVGACVSRGSHSRSRALPSVLVRGPAGSWLVDLEMDGPKGNASYRRSWVPGISRYTRLVVKPEVHTELFSVDDARLRNGLAAAGAREGKGHDSGVYHLDALPRPRNSRRRIQARRDDGQTDSIRLPANSWG